MFIRPKDYIVTNEGLFFAVVSDTIESDRVLTFLRYKKNNNVLKKIETGEAEKLIKSHYPEFIFHSQYADIELHGIPVGSIEHIYRPEETIIKLLALSEPDLKQQDAISIINLLINSGVEKKSLGVTGSIMLNIHNQNSDVDMVVYDRANFFKVRELIKQKTSSGELKKLNRELWQDAYQRRGCAIDFEEYFEHEIKKYNKCLSGNTKVDISMIPAQSEKISESGIYKKLGKEKIVAQVIDDTFAYDFPARFYIGHDSVKEIVVYTATYVGQAKKGDKVEVTGFVEEDKDGNKRLVVGTSREAKGEYIRVLH